MTMFHAGRLCRNPIRRFSVTSLGRAPNTQSPHIYMKTYTKDELLKYMLDNVVYRSSDYIVTSGPQGMKFSNSERWQDSESNVVCQTALQDMIPELCDVFETKECFVTKHPRRNSSGLVILSKSYSAFMTLRKHFSREIRCLNRLYTYLAVVVGCPTKEMEKTFRIEQVPEGDQLSIEILEKSQSDSRKTVQTKYKHTVVDTVDDVSLVKISVSYDLRDCVRHILAQRCFTPVLGDFWSLKRTVNFLFGAPIASGYNRTKEVPYELKSEVLEKLQLNKDEQKYIPIHSHLYSIKMPLLNKSELFISVPPPESFLWTCKQLGLHGIEEFAPGLVEKNQFLPNTSHFLR